MKSHSASARKPGNTARAAVDGTPAVIGVLALCLVLSGQGGIANAADPPVTHVYAGAWQSTDFHDPSNPGCSMGGPGSVTGSRLIMGASRLHPDPMNLVFRKAAWAYRPDTPVMVQASFPDGTSLQLAGKGTGNAVTVLLGADQVPAWIHGLTASKGMHLLFGGDETPWSFDLTGTSTVVNAMADCFRGHQITAVAAPFGTGPSPAQQDPAQTAGSPAPATPSFPSAAAPAPAPALLAAQSPLPSDSGAMPLPTGAASPEPVGPAGMPVPPVPSTNAPAPNRPGAPWLLILVVLGAALWLRGRKGRRQKPMARVGPVTVPVPRPVAAAPRPPAPYTPMRSAAPAVWHPPGTAVTIAGHLVRDGMVYVGSRAPDGSGSPCFIDPGLEVARSDPDTSGAGMGYWPSYSQVAPRCRLAYLRWLAGGKADPATDVGYVFLYFYGLERRMFVDGAGGGEAAAIVAEVERLRGIYGFNRSFNGYSTGFLEAAEFKRGLADAASVDGYRPDLTAPAWSMPMSLKLAIATRVARGEALPFDLAMAGLFGLPPDVHLIDARVLDHARPQLVELVRPAFNVAFPAGFKLANRKDSRLGLLHRCATAGLQVHLGAGAGGEPLPDPSTLTWTKLVKLVIPIANGLEAFAKLKAYRPARAESLSVFATLPGSVSDATVGKSARQARDWLHGLPRPIAKVGFADLARRAIGEQAAKWTLRHHRAVGEALAATSYGMEPHPATGGLALADDTAVFVFQDADAGGTRSKSFEAAAIGAEVVTAVARLDRASPSTIPGTWLARIGERLPLGPAELVRLEARLAWLEGTKPSMGRIKAGLAGASATDRDTVAWSAATAAAAGGMVGREQVAVLEKVYDTLGLGRRDLYAALHGAAADGATPALEPVQVSPGQPGKAYPIPRPPVPLAPPVPPVPTGTLDEDRIRIIKAETERVTSVLSTIFVEEEPPAAPVEPVPGPGGFPGLDAPHAALLAILRAAPSWDRAGFEREARSCGLLPDGALETINEWAFDRFGEPVVEEGDTLSVSVELLAREETDAHAG